LISVCSSTDTIVGIQKTTAGGNSTGLPTGFNYSEEPAKVIDGNTDSKYLNGTGDFSTADLNTGFYVTRVSGASVIGGRRLPRQMTTMPAIR